MENPQASIPGNELENNQIENPQAIPASISEKSELKEDEFWPLSGKPYFIVILSKSHVNGQLTLPVKISRDLLSGYDVPAVLTYCGKNWGVMYLGHRTRFDYSMFKTFVQDNDLEVGDACVFELMESSIDIIRFRVQILRGDYPPELEERVNGETPHAPIVLD